MQEVKRVAVAEVQRAVAVAVAESRATERLRVHRFLDVPLSQRHPGISRHSPFIRVSGRETTTAETTSRTASIPNTGCTASLVNEDEKDPHITTMIGSVRIFNTYPGASYRLEKFLSVPFRLISKSVYEVITVDKNSI